MGVCIHCLSQKRDITAKCYYQSKAAFLDTYLLFTWKSLGAHERYYQLFDGNDNEEYLPVKATAFVHSILKVLAVIMMNKRERHHFPGNMGRLI